MRMTPHHALVGSLAFAASAFVGGAGAQTARPDPPPLPNGAIREWTARYHANAFTDPRINSLTFVVDTNSRYVASSADSLPDDVKAAIDSGFAWVEAHNAIYDTIVELVAGRLRVPGGDSTPPVYVVDGIRVKRVDSLEANSIEAIQLVKPADAATVYGPDAAKSGAIVVKMDHRKRKHPAIEATIRQRLAKLGISAERVDLGNMMWIVTGAGVIGRNPTYINVLHLKGGEP